jgi:hypothetical protein
MNTNMNTNKSPELVQIRDANGTLIYCYLVDTGAEVLRFQSGGGCITRDQIRRKGWTVERMA